MSCRRIKPEVLSLLELEDRSEALRKLQGRAPKAVINVLFSALCSTVPRIRWNAVVLMGKMIDRLASDDFEAARVVMRRLLWSLNDESGGIGWGAPECIAEACCCNSLLAAEYVHMLLSYAREDGDELFQDGNYLELPFLQRGVVWGIARVADCRPSLLRSRGAGPELLAYLETADSEVLGLAALACGLLTVKAATGILHDLQAHDEPVILFLGDGFTETTVGDLATRAVKMIEGAGG